MRELAHIEEHGDVRWRAAARVEKSGGHLAQSQKQPKHIKFLLALFGNVAMAVSRPQLAGSGATFLNLMRT